MVEYLSNGGVAENHKDFKELRYNECLTNFSCNGKNGNSDGSITHSFQLKSAYDSNLIPYTNYTYDFKVKEKFNVCKFYRTELILLLFSNASFYKFRICYSCQCVLPLDYFYAAKAVHNFQIAKN